MRRRFGKNHLIFRMRHQFAEAAGDGDPGSGDGGQSGGEVFNAQTAVDELKGTLAALQKDIGKTSKFGGEIAGLKAMISKLTETVATLKPLEEVQEGDSNGEVEEVEEAPPKRGRPRKVEAENPPKTGDAGSEAALAALQKQIKELQGQVKRASDETATERTARVAAETKQRNLERDRGLLDAATAVGLADEVQPRDVLRFFGPDCEFDDEADTWVYADGDERMSLSDAVKKFLPKYMQKPKTRTGGSGGQSPGSNNGPSRQQLKENAIAVGAKVRSNPRLMSQYSQAKKAFTDAGGDVTEIIDAVAGA